MARLEERFDGVTAAIADLKVAVGELDTHMQAGFAEMRREFSEIRREFGSEYSAIRGEFGSGFSALRSESTGIRSEMNTQFRWIMGGIGSAVLAMIVAILVKG